MNIKHVYPKKSEGAKWLQVLEGVFAEISGGKFARDRGFYTVKELSQAYCVSDITSKRVFQELKARNLIVTDGRRGTMIAGKVRGKQKVYLCLRDEIPGAENLIINPSRIYQEIIIGLTSSAGDEFAVIPASLKFILANPEAFRGKDILVGTEALLDVGDDRVSLNNDILNCLKNAGNPLVLRGLDEISGISQVGIDYRAGFSCLVSHLVRRGRSKLGFICGKTSSPWFRPRFQGYIDGLHEHNLPFNPDFLKITSGIDPKDDYAAVSALLAGAERPDAIICATDQRALNVLEYCRSHGIKVPEQIALTGFDNIHECELCSPELTSLDPHIREVARSAVQLLQQRRAGTAREPVFNKITPELIIRQTT